LSRVGDVASAVGNVSAAYSDTTVAPHEYFDQTGDNQNAINQFKSAPDFDGRVDTVHLLPGGQHEKNVIIRNSGGVIAFCGSADFEKKRLGRLANTGSKQLTGDPSQSPFHEVNLRIEGPVVRDIWNTFCLRYANASLPPPIQTFVEKVRPIKDALALVPIPNPYDPYNPPRADSACAPNPHKTSGLKPGPITQGKDGDFGLCWPSGVYLQGGAAARVVRTLPNGQRQRILNFNFGRETSYGFAWSGEHSYYDFIASAITNTQRYIYLEDQYLFFSASTVLGRTIPQMLRDLLEKDSFQKIVMLIAGTGTIQNETGQAGSHRKAFLEALGPRRDRKVEVYTYNGNPGSPYWVHAKTWIFDDELAVVGSANVNRRGYTGDVELGVAFCDTAISDQDSVVKRLRVDLWEKHLNMQPLNENHDPIPTKKLVPDKTVLYDFMGALPLWGKAPLLVNSGQDLERNPLPDFDIVQQKLSPAPEDEKLKRILKRVAQRLGEKYLGSMEKQWDYVIDPDGG
jgi:phosphatidylserine/phosphatidylglycerophosphate/cardiolipin synthase-like enzyme